MATEETAYHFYKFNRRECPRIVGTTTLSREEVGRFTVDRVSLFFGKTVLHEREQVVGLGKSLCEIAEYKSSPTTYH